LKGERSVVTLGEWLRRHNPASMNSSRVSSTSSTGVVLFLLSSSPATEASTGWATVNPQVDDTWYIGKVEEPLFDQLMMVVPNDILEYAGSYDPPDAG
jgi:hypothetical protein